ncbi:MAG: serine/threonine-protein kinase [Nannocystaceae bacterium]
MEPTPDEAPSHASWLGRVIDDRYRLDRVLGEGGMGAVFVAEHLRLRKEVAFKIIRPEIAGDAKIAARFAREAMATAQIESPHIASAIDYGPLPEGGTFLVTQLARGRSLAAILNDGPLPWPRAVEIAAQIADALSTAHAIGIIHRDLKPDNVIVGERDDGAPLAMVLDFGIASLSHDAAVPSAPSSSGEPLTGYGLVLGTPGYMAPEQAVGDKIDPRTDLYALGVILWESITGVVLWSGDTLTEMVSRQMRAPAPSLREVSEADVPAELAEVVASLLARAPGDRPESAGVVRNELRGLITASPTDLAALSLNAATSGGMPAAAMPAGAAQPTIPDRGRAAPLTLRGEPRDRKVLGLLVACFVLGGALLLVAGSWLLADDPTDAEATRSATQEPAKKSKAGSMSVHDEDDDRDDDRDDEDKGGSAEGGDEFEVVERNGVRRLIRRIRR